MRTRQRFASLVGGTAALAMLAACGSNPTRPMATYPSTPVYPTVSTAPAPSTNYPSAGVSGTQTAAVEWGRVTDIQTVEMGATSATNPNVGRAIAGGIIGAVVGNIAGKHINSGDNRSATTALGGVAGAAIGSRMGQGGTQSSGAASPAYRVTVQTDQGQMRTYEVAALGDLRVGDRVRVESNVIYRS